MKSTILTKLDAPQFKTLELLWLKREETGWRNHLCWTWGIGNSCVHCECNLINCAFFIHFSQSPLQRSLHQRWANSVHRQGNTQWLDEWGDIRVETHHTPYVHQKRRSSWFSTIMTHTFLWMLWTQQGLTALSCWPFHPTLHIASSLSIVQYTGPSRLLTTEPWMGGYVLIQGKQWQYMKFQP